MVGGVQETSKGEITSRLGSECDVIMDTVILIQYSRYQMKRDQIHIETKDGNMQDNSDIQTPALNPQPLGICNVFRAPANADVSASTTH